MTGDEALLQKQEALKRQLAALEHNTLADKILAGPGRLIQKITRRLVVENMVVKVGTEQTLNISEASFTLSWTSFFKKRFHLEKVDLNNATITMEELPDGRWRIGGLLPTPSAEK